MWRTALFWVSMVLALDALLGLIFYPRIQRLSRLPLGRIATIEAVAAVVLFAAWWLTKGT